MKSYSLFKDLHFIMRKKKVKNILTCLGFVTLLAPKITLANPISGVHLLKSWASYYSCVFHLISFKDSQAHAELYGHRNRVGMGPSVLQTNHSSFLTRKLVQYHQTKRSECTYTCVMFILFGVKGVDNLSFNSVEDLSLVLDQLQSSVFLHVNPRFISFGIPTTQGRNINFDTFLTTLPLIHISATYLVVSQDSPYINLVCQYCTEIGGIIKKLKNVRGVGEMNREWLQLHKNLSFTPVTVKRTELKGFSGSNRHHCDSLGTKFYGDKKLCAFKWMEKLLNFKAVYTATKNKLHPRVSTVFKDLLSINYNKTLSEVSNQIEVDNFQVIMIYRYAKRDNIKLEWIPHVWNVNPIAFAVVLDKSMLSRSALAKPFDQETWFFTAISWVVVSLILVLCLWIHDIRSRKCINTGTPYSLQKKSYPDAIKIMMITLGSIIEQNPSDLTIKKAIVSFQILFGTWLIISLVLSNAYTGIVISFLCSEIVPHNLPNSFQELVTSFSYFPIITSDTVFVAEHNITVPVLPSLIKEFVDLANQSAFPALITDYRKLRSTIIHLHRTTKSKLIYLYDKQIRIPGDEISVNSSYKLPSEFVYASLDSYVTRFTKIMKRNPHVTMWHPPPNDLIRVIQAFSVTRNYFSTLFRKYSYFITEAGFQTIWERKERERYYKLDLERYNNLTICNDSKIWSDLKCLPELGNGSSVGYMRSEFDGYEDSKPLALTILSSLFMLYFAGILISIFIILFEVTFKIFRQDKVFSLKHFAYQQQFRLVSKEMLSTHNNNDKLATITGTEAYSRPIDEKMDLSISIPGRMSSQLKHL